MVKGFDEHITQLISTEMIRNKVSTLGKKITQDYMGKELICVCILKGSIVFFSDLIREIKLPVTIDFIRVSSYGNALESSGDVKINKDLSSPIKGKHILLIEDIIDTGVTVDFLLELFEAREPASLKVCSLLHKPSNKKKEVPITYKGFTIENHFVVGYGMDAAEQFRNISYIGVYPTKHTIKEKT